mmetsp:Transcript_4416/g.16868  ORF Transcript_4416/g.16868 Transcript_4416/m.16868 type:complete len:216 (+) Transcript_4416:352-999(+)
MLALVEHGHELLDVGLVERDVLEKWNRVQSQRAASRRGIDGGVVHVRAGNGLGDVAKPKAILQEYGHVLQHRLFLARGQVERNRVYERLPRQCRCALQALKVVNLVARVLVDDEQVVAEHGEDETKIELAHDSHFGEIGFVEHALKFARRRRVRRVRRFRFAIHGGNSRGGERDFRLRFGRFVHRRDDLAAHVSPSRTHRLHRKRQSAATGVFAR